MQMDRIMEAAIEIINAKPHGIVLRFWLYILSEQPDKSFQMWMYLNWVNSMIAEYSRKFPNAVWHGRVIDDVKFDSWIARRCESNERGTALAIEEGLHWHEFYETKVRHV